MAKNDMPFPEYKTANLSDLVPYARNSRTHSESQVEKIAQSIKEFGFINPVIVDSGNCIIAGHGRVMAAQKIGMDVVPVIEASHLTDAQRRAYVIADNKLALDAGWDDEILKSEFDALADSGFDLDLTGFTLDEISKVFDETKGVKIEDSVPDVSLDEIIVRFPPQKRVHVMNAVDSAISDIKGAQIWCDDE